MARLVARMCPHASTVFAETTALAVATGAVNLGQGFPDTDGPGAVLELAARSLREGGPLNQYPPGRGLPVLRQAVAAHRRERYGLSYDPDTEVLVTVGATEAVTASVLALCEPGDEVIVLEPWYDSHVAAVDLAGAVRRSVALRPDAAGGRFTVDPDELAAAFGPSTRLVIVNSPHNPTGTVLDQDELALLARLCQEHDVVAVTDEVYEHLTYDGAQHLPLAALPGMRERTISTSSAGKTFSVTGWKVGWVCAPADLLAAVVGVKQWLTFTHSGPLQVAVAHALTAELGWVEQQRQALQAQRDLLCDGLAKLGLDVHVPQSGYFALVGTGAPDGQGWARALPRVAGVAAIPVSPFCEQPVPWVRFAFCKQPEVLTEALERMRARL